MRGLVHFRRLTRAFLLAVAPALALASCDECAPECAEAPRGRAVAICVVPQGATEPDHYWTGEVTASGPVLEAGDGEVPDGCMGSYQPEDTPSWIRMEDAEGAVWTIGFANHGGSPAFAVGDELNFRHTATRRPPEYMIRSTEIRDAEGQLLVWRSSGVGLRDVDPIEELSFDRGEVLCRDSDTCGSFAYYDLTVTAPGHESTALPYGESVELGGLRVLHGGYTGDADLREECYDWNPSFIAVSAHRVD